MRRYLKDARHCFNQIQYYHRHAPVGGYAQAEPYYSKIGNLQLSAEKSKNDKKDAIVIQALRESAGVLIEEMRQREENNERIQTH